MEEIRNVRQRGTPSLPAAVYWATAGVNMKDHPNVEYHPDPEIVLVSQGNITMQLGGETKVFSQGDIFIIPSNIVHRRTHFSEDAKTWTLVFTPEAIRMQPEHFFQKEFVQPLMENRLEFPLLLQPGHPAYDNVFRLMNQLEYCRSIREHYRQNRLRVLMSICLELMPYCRVLSGNQTVPNPGHEAVMLCMEYIHGHIAEKLTLDEIAQHCHLHPNYLCAVFKQYTGETIFEYRNRFRVETAAKLLQMEDLPVSKVAELSGFHSECQFYQKFKAHTGMTPKTYRGTTSER